LRLAKHIGPTTVDGVACQAYKYQLGDTKPGDTLVTYWFCIDHDLRLIAVNLTNYIKSAGEAPVHQQTVQTPAPYFLSVQSTVLKMSTGGPNESIFEPLQDSCVDLTSNKTISGEVLVNDLELIRRANADAHGYWHSDASPVFAGTTLSSARMLAGTKIRPLQLSLGASSAVTQVIPNHFDARDHWTRCRNIGRINNQQKCGSCWAWAAVEVFADRMCIQHYSGNFTGSAEYMLDCDQDDNSCAGGLLDDAWKFLHQNGVPSDSCDPYTALNGSGQVSCPGRCTDGSELHTLKASSAYGVAIPGDVQAMQLEILTYGPIQVAFYVFSDFMTYSNGTYFRTPAAAGPVGGHSVKIVGWGVDIHGTDYWIAINSWGETWGEGGSFRIRRGTNECGVETTPVAGHC